MSDARLDRLTVGTAALDRDRLEPGGTVRARFLRARGEVGPDPHHDVYVRAAALDVPAGAVDAARAIADLGPAETDPATRTALFHLALAVVLDNRMGSTRTPVRGAGGQRSLRARLEPLLGPERAHAASAAIAALLDAGGVPGVLAETGVAPLIFEGDAVVTHRLRRLEHRVVRALVPRGRPAAARRPAEEVGAAIAGVQGRPAHRGGAPSPLSDEQVAAVALAATRSMTVVSGGPGTGKTSIAIALIRTLARLGVGPDRTLLAAPTGKAAHRLAESIASGLAAIAEPDPIDQRIAARLASAETLHRLLGYSPRRGRFTRDRDDPLSADVVIVDEASMIDLRLMDALLDGLTATTQLVLLGDVDQLPSVDAGAVLRDLTGSDPGGRFTVRLTHSYRMDAADPRGAEILTAARAVRSGATPAGPVRAKPQRLAYAGFEQLEAVDPVARRRFFDAWVARHLSGRAYQRAARRIVWHRDGAFRAGDARAIEALMARVNGFRLLAVTRTDALPTGADALNAAIHERLAAMNPGANPGPLPGEPVMMLRNDYERGLFNGDVGVVMQVAVDQQAAAPMVVFAAGGGYEPFPQSMLQQDLTLAHAMTVHKAQGSEFDEVALVLPDVDVPNLSREVLYTGLTRARTSVVVVGAPALTARACARPVVRHSGIAAELQAAWDVRPDEPGA